ncbi:unnamed protein product [Durusdinium trenchii]|uniref:Uncharacterized protein n=1 Tax=Durusdinium trenchii TaxID=1381693 RepID=A0ABP0M626_9DINO
MQNHGDSLWALVRFLRSQATPAARRKTQGPLMPPLPPSALKPDCPVSAPEAVGGWPEAEPPTTAAAEAPAAAPAATAAEAPTPAAAPADVPEMPPLSTSAPRVDPRKQSAQLAAPPTMQPIMQPAAQPAAQPTIQSPAAAQPSLPLPGRQEVSRKTATQLRSELNRLREAMERQNSTESSGKSSDMNALKEELMKLQKQLEESEQENQELRAKQSTPADAGPPRRRGRKSMRNRTMDLTQHRKEGWQDVEGESAEESDMSDVSEDLDALLGLARSP